MSGRWQTATKKVIAIDSLDSLLLNDTDIRRSLRKADFTAFCRFSLQHIEDRPVVVQLLSDTLELVSDRKLANRLQNLIRLCNSDFGNLITQLITKYGKDLQVMLKIFQILNFFTPVGSRTFSSTSGEFDIEGDDIIGLTEDEIDYSIDFEDLEIEELNNVDEVWKFFDSPFFTLSFAVLIKNLDENTDFVEIFATKHVIITLLNCLLRFRGDHRMVAPLCGALGNLAVTYSVDGIPNFLRIVPILFSILYDFMDMPTVISPFFHFLSQISMSDDEDLMKQLVEYDVSNLLRETLSSHHRITKITAYVALTIGNMVKYLSDFPFGKVIPLVFMALEDEECDSNDADSILFFFVEILDKIRTPEMMTMISTYSARVIKLEDFFEVPEYWNLLSKLVAIYDVAELVYRNFKNFKFFDLFNDVYFDDVEEEELLTISRALLKFLGRMIGHFQAEEESVFNSVQIFKLVYLVFSKVSSDMKALRSFVAIANYFYMKPKLKRLMLDRSRLNFLKTTAKVHLKMENPIPQLTNLINQLQEEAPTLQRHSSFAPSQFSRQFSTNGLVRSASFAG
ncbi:hypothetical protein PCE1_003935 [Barthelona sp. PCE]